MIDPGASIPPPTYTVAVRTLVEFTAKRGDLDLRFTPSSSALEGMAGHAVVLARRGASYQREVSLSADFRNLRVKGRADGFDPEQALLEEVKTYRGDLAAMPANKRALHWAQAKVYGALLCRMRGLAELRVALVYFNLATRTETVFVEQHRACELGAFFEAQCLQFLDWAIAEQLHRADRDAALALHFTRMCEAFGSHSVFDLTRDLTRDLTLTRDPASDARAAGAPGQGRSVLSIRNIVPAPFLRPRFAALHTATLFSATLSPTRFYADLLGLPANAAWVDVESPFTASQLKVHIVDRLSTRFRHRGRSLSPIVSLIARQFEQAPGNYLAFFSSFEYLRMAAALFRTRHPGIASWEQAPAMPEASRAAFLERFTETSEGIGFAVLGGAFGEAIDLPGRRLIGAFVATLGLPQVNPVNEQMKSRMDEIFGDGYDYTYLYPGLRRVVQAAGRVIRTPHDRGTLYLIDDRFATAKVRALLPAWWSVSDAAIDVEPCPA